jgi:hypothetical protein
MDSQLIKSIATGSNIFGGNPTQVGLFNRFGSKGVLSDNFVGASNISTLAEGQNKPLVSKNAFIYNYIIGKGGFGKVWRV